MAEQNDPAGNQAIQELLDALYYKLKMVSPGLGWRCPGSGRPSCCPAGRTWFPAGSPESPADKPDHPGFGIPRCRSEYPERSDSRTGTDLKSRPSRAGLSVVCLV